MVVLDEIMYPLRYGWIALDDVLACLRERPRHVHVVLTGRARRLSWSIWPTP